MPARRGAKAAAPAQIPAVDPQVCAAISDYLQEHYDSKRPPEVAAAMLALVLELHRTHRPFPPRADVVRAFGLSGPYGLDAAIYTALSRQLITQEMIVADGYTQRREGINQRRRFVPSPELLDIGRRASRRAA